MRPSEIVRWIALASAVTTTISTISTLIYEPLISRPQVSWTFLVTETPLPLAIASWFALLAMYWKGVTRSLWLKRGFDYAMFRVLVRMRGSGTRQDILTRLREPKYISQLAEELGLDFKTVQHHIQVLAALGLIETVGKYGNIQVFQISQRGSEILKLLSGQRSI
jgi:DNA-binding transcriptional ArsR family regulator